MERLNVCALGVRKVGLLGPLLGVVLCAAAARVEAENGLRWLNNPKSQYTTAGWQVPVSITNDGTVTHFADLTKSAGCSITLNGTPVTSIAVAAGATKTYSFNIPNSGNNGVPGTYTIGHSYIDAGTSTPDFVLTVTVPPPPACSDGIDNDGDTKTDYPQDPGCSSSSDDDEYNAPPPACSDGADNDGDGKTDYPLDPGCTSGADTDEYNPPIPQCNDGVDNDGDGKIDLQDPQCSGSSDDSEAPEPPAPPLTTARYQTVMQAGLSAVGNIVAPMLPWLILLCGIFAMLFWLRSTFRAGTAKRREVQYGGMGLYDKMRMRTRQLSARGLDAGTRQRLERDMDELRAEHQRRMSIADDDLTLDDFKRGLGL